MVETAVEDRADALRRLAAAEEQAAAEESTNRENTEALEVRSAALAPQSRYLTVHPIFSTMSGNGMYSKVLSNI